MSKLNVKEEELINVASAKRRVQLGPAESLRYHLIEIGQDVHHSTFQTYDDFSKNVNERLKAKSGQPTRLYLFCGYQIEMTTPQITVGLNMPGPKRHSPVMLTRGQANPGGHVPQMPVHDGA